MTPAAAYADLLQQSRELAVLQSCAAVLGWDQQTYMPKAGGPFRGEQLALLAGLSHTRATDPRFGERLSEVEGSDLVGDPDSVEAANAREWRRGYDRATKLPARLVEELARVTTAAQDAWAEARAASDFAAFRPHLEKVVALKREEADAVGHAGERYDALLDEYEPGQTAAAVRTLFAELSSATVPLLERVKTFGASPRSEVLRRDYPVERQKLFAEGAAAAIGFRFTAGRLDTTTHPFCSGLGPGDCRITTRYNPKGFHEAFFGVLHEAGHGLYEQGLPEAAFGTPCGSFASLGVHESQSRFWENFVGRSAPFWEHFLPRLQQAFPGTLDDVSRPEFVAAVNEVKPSLIRVESDELTYNLHVALRFELEVALLRGDLAVADLPGAWNERFRKLLGIEVPSDREGCLQDIHWSFGGLGYFPTYTLGNLLAAEWMEAAEAHFGAESLAAQLRAGDFAPLGEWMRSNVHAHGRRYLPAELCRRVTGHAPTAAPLVRHLRAKVGAITKA